MKQLTAASIAAPGFNGINTQDSPTTLEAGFALQASNCIIDKYGRLGARKGWRYVAKSGGVPLKGGHRFVDIAGVEYIGVWSGTSFYIFDPVAGTLTSVPYVGSNVITEDGWQAATLNDAAYLFNNSYEPVYFNPVTGQIDDIVNVGHGVVPKGNCVLSAYGRLWTANTATNKTTVYWSTLLDGKNFASGTAGSLDLSAVLVQGNDEIVALGAHSGRLIIFCRDNIVIYGDSQGGTTINPANLTLVEVIKGVGCIARDSVQNTGTDIIFLSGDGVISLGRLIQEKSQPFRDISRNVRDDLMQELSVSDLTKVKSIYSIDEAFYLLLNPEFRRAYCFDMRSQLPDGSARVTIWEGQSHSGMIITPEELYFTNNNGVAIYDGYQDNGEQYVMKYFTTHLDFGDATSTKYLKRIGATLIGSGGRQMTFKVATDYSNNYTSYPVTLPNHINAIFGESEYNAGDEFTIGILSDTIRTPAGGGGNSIQVGLEAIIDNDTVSVQKFDLYIKQGRMY